MINYRLKFKYEDTPKMFWVGDLHYNHDRDFIWGAPGRNYKHVDEMNTDIIHSWNSNCDHTSTVFHVGDIIFGDSTGEKLLNLYERLNFNTLYCIFGNHTSGERTIFKTLMEEYGFDDKEVYPAELKINSEKRVVFLGYYAEVEIDQQYIMLAHYPIESWNYQRRNSWMIHGHCHGNLPNEKKLKRLDVGWDYKRKPVSYKEIKAEMNILNGTSGDHHNENN